MDNKIGLAMADDGDFDFKPRRDGPTPGASGVIGAAKIPNGNGAAKISPSPHPTIKPDLRLPGFFEGSASIGAKPFRPQTITPQDSLRFDLKVDERGYAWWYVDALSDDRKYALTIIAFIGSVFSPYYAWSKSQNPFNHCALNVALYGPDKSRWCMTERGSKDIQISAQEFVIGPSAVSWDGTTLTINIEELGAPLPQRVKGTVKVRPPWISNQAMVIDRFGKHIWHPLSPSSRVEVDMASPDLSWSGDAYLDSNHGEEPLAEGFDYWDWSRSILGNGEAAITYNTDFADGGRQSLALLFDNHGELEMFKGPPIQPMPSTPIWRITRRTRCEKSSSPRIVKTLEDVPFYSRSVIETRLFGKDFHTVHESLSCHRLRSPVVKSLLPFRMPRLAR
ncbi:MAG: carotenoid 1,2-hydratase [Pseudomonadota bacterium]